MERRIRVAARTWMTERLPWGRRGRARQLEIVVAAQETVGL
jgi:hypothetical protein